MKQFLGTVVAFFFVLAASAQYSIKGHVVNKQTSQPIEGVSISVLSSGAVIQVSATDQQGNFLFSNLNRKGTYAVTTAAIGFKANESAITFTNEVANIDIELEPQSYFLEPLEVKSVRASEKAPFAKTNISKQEIAKTNLGQDLPFLLNQTPSVVINSDAGNGVGYTALRIRGSDATRINVTLNGIPYNDAESQGTYFVDLPDIASSLNSIQIQRGVGTSSNGAGAFGATMALSTNEFNEKGYGELDNSYGSFNTWKHTLKAGSGLINNHFTIDARLSKINSDGFIDRAASDLKSLYLSAAYYNKNSSLRFNIITGKEKTYQAWNGIPESMLNTNRTYNSAGTDKPGAPYENETDNYQQDHYQLFYNHSFTNKLSFNTALFLSQGKGYYEQYKAGENFSSYGLANVIVGTTTITKTDLVRQLWLANNYYGQILSLQYKNTADQLTFGGGWNRYNGNHFGEIIWAQTGISKDYRYYDFDALKTDENVYAKWQHDLSKHWQSFADLQYRHVGYDIGGFRTNPTLKVDRNFSFLNPKAGITYTNSGWQGYLSYALSNKEPNRDDFEAGTVQQPKYETLHDFELGIEKKVRNFSWGATAYYMRYKNQLILTGQVNDVGAYTRENVPNSYRLGLELQGTANFASWVNASANFAVSRNKVNAFDEYVDEYNAQGDYLGQVKYHHTKTDISFSPSIVGGATVNFIPVKNAEISLLGKYVGRQYLDNNQDKTRSLHPYYVQDIRASYKIVNKLFSGISIIGQVNNLLNRKYEPNGYTYSYIYDKVLTTENYYYPMAGINFMAGVNISF